MKWLKSSEKEGCKAEFQSFVRDQRDLEYGPSVRRPVIDNILDYCVGQASFRCRKNLYRVGVVLPSLVGPGLLLYINWLYVVSGLQACCFGGSRPQRRDSSIHSGTGFRHFAVGRGVVSRDLRPTFCSGTHVHPTLLFYREWRGDAECCHCLCFLCVLASQLQPLVVAQDPFQPVCCQ